MLNKGFTLIELIAVITLVGIFSIVFFSRIDSVGTSHIQSGRDDLIAALFFAQQQAMMRSDITFELTANSISVNENGSPIPGTQYPLAMPAGVTLSSDPDQISFSYDKLGRRTAAVITLTGSGNSSGVTATIQVDASGYAYAQ